MGEIPVRVVTLWKDMTLKYPAKNTAQKLFEDICDNLSIREVWYFGLYYTTKNEERIWIDRSRKKVKSYKNQLDHLGFGIKFYPENVENDVIETITRKYFFKDMRSKIVSGQVYCPADKCLLLASFVCQIKYGDFSSSVEYDVESLIPAKVMKQHSLGKDKITSDVNSLWEKHKGTWSEDVILEYLKETQELNMTGIHYFNIANQKKSKVVLGITPLGIDFYSETEIMVPESTFPWSEIKHLSYKNKNFTIQIENAKSLTFYASDASVNKQIWNLAIGYHKLYLTRRKPSETLQVSEMRKNAMESRNILLSYRQKYEKQEQLNKELEENYKRKLDEIIAELNLTKEKLKATQETIDELQRRLSEIERAKETLEARERELERMTQELTERTNMDEAEKQRMQLEIDLKKTEIDQLAQEFDAKNEETQRLQKEMELAKQQYEEIQQSALEKSKEALALDREDIETMEGCEEIEEPQAKPIQLAEQVESEMKVIQETLKNAQIEESNEDKVYQNNLRNGKSKYETLKNIRKGNTTRRIDLFENI